MIAILILVGVFAMIPLMLWATRARNRQVRWQGIDWTRGMSARQKAVLEGTELHQAHKYAQAIEAYDRAIQLEADDREALLGRAVACHRLGKLDAALADYDRAIAIHGPTPEALNNRGCLQRDRGDLARAIADLEEAARMDPAYAIAHVSLAEALADRADWDAALDALRRGIAADATWREHARTAEALAKLREARPDADVFTA